MCAIFLVNGSENTSAEISACFRGAHTSGTPLAGSKKKCAQDSYVEWHLCSEHINKRRFPRVPYAFKTVHSRSSHANVIKPELGSAE